MKFLGDFWGFRFLGQNGKLKVKICEKRITKVGAKRGRYPNAGESAKPTIPYRFALSIGIFVHFLIFSKFIYFFH